MIPGVWEWGGRSVLMLWGQDIVDTKKKVQEYTERGWMAPNTREAFLMNVSFFCRVKGRRANDGVESGPGGGGAERGDVLGSFVQLQPG